MNKKNSMPFREQLLSQEKNDAKLKNKFNQEAKKMYTEKLKKGQRLALVLVSFIITFITLLFWLFAQMFQEMQIGAEIAFIEPLRLASMWLMFLCIGLTLLCLWPAFIGKVGLIVYPKLVRLVLWITLLVTVMFSIMVIDIIDSHEQIRFVDIACGFVAMILIIMIGLHLIQSIRIDKNDLNNKERLLEMECRLTELEEKLGQG